MSCNYSVWHTSKRLTAAEAGELHIRLCEGDTSGVTSHSGIQAFYAELTAQHPEIDDVTEEQLEDKDLCPWSVAFDRSDGHLMMCCIWPKTDYVGQLVKPLAAKHGLAFYDPQAEWVVYPDGEASPKPWWKFW